MNKDLLYNKIVLDLLLVIPLFFIKTEIDRAQ